MQHRSQKCLLLSPIIDLNRRIVPTLRGPTFCFLTTLSAAAKAMPRTAEDNALKVGTIKVICTTVSPLTLPTLDYCTQKCLRRGIANALYQT